MPLDLQKEAPDLAAIPGGATGQVVHTYEIPKRSRRPGQPTKVGMVELTAKDELLASKLGGDDLRAVQFEAAKRAVRFLDGKRTTSDAVDEWWDACGSPVRALVMTAYARLSSPAEGDADVFLQSVEVSTL